MLGQDDILDKLKEKRRQSPTEVIVYVESLLLSKENFDTATFIKLKRAEALAYQENSNHQKALNSINEILKRLDKNSNEYIEVLLIQSYSNAYLNNFSDASQQALKALELANIKEDNSLIASANTALSFIHYSNNNYETAFQYLASSAQMQKKAKDSSNLSATYNNIAIIYKKMANFKEALNYNKKSLAISIAIKDYLGISKSYSNIGRVYELLGDKTKAISYYQKAIDNNLKAKVNNSIPYRNMGDVFMKNNELLKAKEFYYKALATEKDNGNHKTLKSINKALLQIAMREKDFEKALLYQSKSDSLSKLIARHDYDEKIKALENQQKLLQNRKEILQIKEINTKNSIIYGVLTGLLLLVLLLFFLKSKNTKLKDEQDKLRLEQRVLRSQMNPHFIFNVLSSIQNSLLDNDPIKSAGYISKFAKLIRQNFDFINQKSILLSEEIDALQNYMDTQKVRFNDKFDYEINIFQDVDIHTIEVPPMLIQPFIENAIEHGFKNKKELGKIVVNINKIPKKLCFEIIDNGRGFETTHQNTKTHAIDIFKKRLKLLGNNDEKSFTIQSTTTTGTTIKFCLKNA